MVNTQVPVTQKLSITLDLIERLKGGGAQRFPNDEVKQIIDLLTEEHHWPAVVLEPYMHFYRGRKVEGIERFTQKSELTALPGNKVRNIGRCHTVGKSTLYASNNIEAVAAEIGASPGDRIQVVRIRPKTDQLKAVIIGEADHLRRYGHSIFFRGSIDKDIELIWRKMSNLERLRFNLTDAFLADQFRQEVRREAEYKITSSLATVLFDSLCDAIFYPSVAHLGGLNIAVRGDVLEEHFEFEESVVFDVHESLGYGIYSLPEVARSKKITAEGEIDFPDSDYIKLYGDFENFVWANRSFSGRTVKILNGVALKFDLSERGFRSMRNTKLPDQPDLFQLNLHMGQTFSSLKKDLDDAFPGWEMIYVEVISVRSNDEVREKSIGIHDRIINQNGVGAYFTTAGQQIPFPNNAFDIGTVVVTSPDAE